MRYPESLIEEIREKNDIVDVIGEYVKLKRAGNGYVGLCPFHNEKTPSFSVSGDKQLYYCFGCHRGGNVYTFIREYRNADFQEAVEILADRCGVTLPEKTMSSRDREKEDKRSLSFEIMKSAASFYYYKLRNKGGERAYSYLTDRGLSEETINRFGLGYSGKYSNELYKYLRSRGYKDRDLSQSGLFTVREDRGFTDKFWNRVMFPITDVRGRVIGFGGRVMGDAKPKYLNSPETEIFNKRKNLFGLSIARNSARDRMIICEGYMDVITMHQAGFANSVASLGTALTVEQAMLLKRFTGEIILMYDSDDAGVNAAVRAVEILDDVGLMVKVADLSPYKDPDEFIKAAGAEELRNRIDNARNGFLFTIDRMSRDYDFEDPKSKTLFEHDVALKLMDFSDELERNNYLERICSIYGIPADSMRRLIRQYAASGRRTVKRYTSGGAGVIKVDPVSAEQLILYYIANYPGVWKDIRDVIDVNDFSDGFTKEAGKKIVEHIKKGDMNPASFINEYEDLEDQNRITSILSRDVPAKDSAEQDQAFTDIIIDYRRTVNDERLANCTDPVMMMELANEKKKIEEFERSGKVYHLSREGNK